MSPTSAIPEHRHRAPVAASRPTVASVPSGRSAQGAGTNGSARKPLHRPRDPEVPRRVRIRLAARIPIQYGVRFGVEAYGRVRPGRTDIHPGDVELRLMPRQSLGRVRRAELSLWLGGVLRWRDDWAPVDHHLVGLVDGRRIAHVGIATRSAEFNGCVSQIGMVGAVYTDPRYRSRGVASTLMNEACERMIEHGLSHGLLMCASPLQAFYERLGWSRVAGPLSFDWGRGRRTDRGCTMVRCLSTDASLPQGHIGLYGKPV